MAPATSSTSADGTTAARAAVVVPAFEPDDRLVALVRALRAAAPARTIVVVDDGSGPGYAGVFAAARDAGARLVAHPTNKGKGMALKTGFAYVRDRVGAVAVVCADSDGQHAPADVERVAGALAAHGDGIVLGARDVGASGAPLRSRVGNGLTRVAFGAVTGLRLHDTQTGLRGYPASLLPWLATVGGSRFEYELAVLLAAARRRIPLYEVPIETIYLDANASSHFRPLRDSARVYGPLVRAGARRVITRVWGPRG